MQDVLDQVNEATAVVASRKRRIVAFLIDHIVMSFVIAIIVFLALGPGFIDDDDSAKFIATVFAAGLPAFFLYFAKDSIKGISLGRWILGIMVRDSNNPNNIPGFGRLLLRNLFLMISPIEFIVLALGKDKKRIGDRAASTLVVKNPNKPGKLPRFMALVAVGVVFVGFTYVLGSTAIKNSEAYRVAIKEIGRNPEITAETGGIKGYGMMPGGNMSIQNGVGDAQLEIEVLGEEENVNVSVHLTKQAGSEWVIEGVHLE